MYYQVGAGAGAKLESSIGSGDEPNLNKAGSPALLTITTIL